MLARYLGIIPRTSPNSRGGKTPEAYPHKLLKTRMTHHLPYGVGLAQVLPVVVVLPHEAAERPSEEFITWHNEQVFSP